jgi:AcrR family transcriptional regulator
MTAPTTTTTTTATTAAADGGARARARVEIRAAILAAAAERLASDGADELSLRAVARDVGMVSSAVYRYFASRDELLTALVIRAYDSLGDHVEARVRATAGWPAAQRWVDAGMSVRSWALDHPNDYALIYGTPIRGYAAPEDTVAAGTRVSRALVGIVRDADGRDPVAPVPVEPVLAESFAALRSELDLDVDDATTLAIVTAWTQLFGLLTFELFGQTRNLVTDDEALFRAATTAMAASIGLRSG